MPTPILIVGRTRSGTKWLTNRMANHSRVACVRHPRHGGVIETNTLTRAHERFGAIRLTENYIAFLSVFATSDFGKVAGASFDELVELRFDSYPTFFRHVMDRYATSQGCDFWVQKLNPWGFELSGPSFPDAKVMGIRRDARSNLQSQIGLRMRTGYPIRPQHLVNQGFLYAAADAKLRAHLGSNPLLRFEDLKDKPEATLRLACDHVGIAFEPAMLQDQFEPNTSYIKGTSAEKVDDWRLTLATGSARLFGALPSRALDALERAKHRHHRRQLRTGAVPAFVPGSFKLTRDQHGLD